VALSAFEVDRSTLDNIGNKTTGYISILFNPILLQIIAEQKKHIIIIKNEAFHHCPTGGTSDAIPSASCAATLPRPSRFDKASG